MKIRFSIALFLLTLLLPSFVSAQVADVDIVPPVITAPVEQSFIVEIIPITPELILATATDDTDPNPVISYSPSAFDFGTTTVEWTATDAYGNFATTTSEVVVSALASPAPEVAPIEIAHIAIRYGETLVGPFDVDLATISATSTVELFTTDATSTHTVSSRSLLALVSMLDTEHDEFSINALLYYDSFGAFYLKCVTIPSATSVPECDNWTYTVNGTSPLEGIDSYALKNGDSAYLFFGQKRLATIATSTVTVNTSFTVSAKLYNPVNNDYLPQAGVTIGITQPDPMNPWSPIEIATSTVDENGEAVFNINTAGSYSVGIKEDYYYPATTLVVTDVALPVTQDPLPVTGGGGSYAPVLARFDTARAFAYLSSQQSNDGSFGSSMITDWVAIAFANAGTPLEAKEKLHAYLLSAVPTLTSVTDYERHAMALEALGINPYTGTSINYIKKITESFDGMQIGDTGLVNDDIFALFPLIHAGYSLDDEIIKKTVEFILTHQSLDGSWESVDMTSAGVQALSLVSGQDGVSSALAKAKTYLQLRQQNDGGFGNSFSTSWVMQAISSFGENALSWVNNGKNPSEYLASLQQVDGGLDLATVDMKSRIWATAYGVPASLEKSWTSLLKTFAKPVVVVGGSGAGGMPEVVTVATTTLITATTTPVIVFATSSPAVKEIIIATTTPQVVAPKIVKKAVAPTTENQKIKPVAVPHVSSSTNQLASVPENKVGNSIAHFFETILGGINSFIKWFF